MKTKPAKESKLLPRKDESSVFDWLPGATAQKVFETKYAERCADQLRSSKQSKDPREYRADVLE